MPVTVVEALQMVRVEAITEVRRQTERLECARFPQARGDRAVAVHLLPRALMSRGKLRHRHVQRLEDNMLTIIELPVAREDAALARQARVQRRAGEWRDDGEAREVDAGVDGEIGGRFEDVEVIVIEAEDEAALDGDAEVVEIGDQLPVIDRAIEALVRVGEAAGRDRFETEEEAAAAGAGHE